MAEIPEWYQDKCLHILQRLIRKCRIQKRALLHFTYPEKGIVEIHMRDLETGNLIIEPTPEHIPVLEDEEIDPLS